MAAQIFGEAVPPHMAAEAEAEAKGRSLHERFAVPFMFQPVLTVSSATVLALRALVRIMLGSLLFGACGACALWLWFAIGNPFLRAATMIPMLALFLALLGGMMIATSRLMPIRVPR